MQINKNGEGGFYIFAPDYDIERTFTCGQCFRFKRNYASPFECEYSGIAHGRYMRFASDGKGNIHIMGADEEELRTLWLHYLSLDRDYGVIKRQILEDFSNHGFMRAAIERTGGLRILAQDRFETLCSFIISQNNNIPRITKIIEAICESYGERLENGEGYTFPTADRLAKVSVEEFAALKMGYRAKYIADAAKRVSSGSLQLYSLTAENAREELLRVLGVGEKVAACIRLFAIEDLSAFPVDVWIKRVSQTRFDGKLDPQNAGVFGGVAQQYLFCYERELS